MVGYSLVINPQDIGIREASSMRKEHRYIMGRTLGPHDWIRCAKDEFYAACNRQAQ